MAIGVTARANELLVFIASYQANRGGISPSFAEMREALGYDSKHQIFDLLTQLEERGRIARLPRRARAISVLEGPMVPLLDMTDRTKFEHQVWDDGEKRLVPLAARRDSA